MTRTQFLPDKYNQMEMSFHFRESVDYTCTHWISDRGGPRTDMNIMTFYVYGSVHHNIFYEITNRCSYMQSILFHC